MGPWTGIPLLVFLGMLIGMVVGLLARAVMSIQPLWGKVPSCPTGTGEPSTAIQPPGAVRPMVIPGHPTSSETQASHLPEIGHGYRASSS